jgi:hypothetical protein
MVGRIGRAVTAYKAPTLGAECLGVYSARGIAEPRPCGRGSVRGSVARLADSHDV